MYAIQIHLGKYHLLCNGTDGTSILKPPQATTATTTPLYLHCTSLPACPGTACFYTTTLKAKTPSPYLPTYLPVHSAPPPSLNLGRANSYQPTYLGIHSPFPPYYLQLHLCERKKKSKVRRCCCVLTSCNGGLQLRRFLFSFFSLFFYSPSVLLPSSSSRPPLSCFMFAVTATAVIVSV